MNDNVIVDTKYLRECRLWSGSLEDTSETYGGGVRVIDIKRRIERFERCDDLTDAEKEYLEALRKTLEQS